MEERMFRKTSVALAALLVATTAAFSPAAHAATKISNGVKCTKKNATTKVGTDKYVCTTNPTNTSKNLIWVWQGCIDANKSYLDNKAQYSALLKSSSNTVKNLQDNIQAQINSLISWKSTRKYLKGDIAFEADKTYYVALTDSENKQPSLNLNTAWAIYKPTASDPNVGTSPDSNSAIAWKQADINSWAATVAKLTDNLQKLQSYQNPDSKTKLLISQTQALIISLNSGIRSAKTKIENLLNSIKMLETQKTNQNTLEILKSNVTQAASLRTQSCAKGV
jgi:hypothetical protein